MSTIDWGNYEAGREDDPAYCDGYVDGYRAARPRIADREDTARPSTDDGDAPTI